MRFFSFWAVCRALLLFSVHFMPVAFAQSLPSTEFLSPPGATLPEPYCNSLSPLAPTPNQPDALPPPANSTTQYPIFETLLPACDACPTHGFYGFFGYDSWRGIQDDGGGNNGLHKGLNFATRLGPISDWTGFGFQIGGSVGVYNLNGTNYHLSHNDEATPQGFLTYGFFRKANDTTPLSIAIVQDWMFTSNFGVFAQNPTLSQWRGQLGYAFGPRNELGLWGALRGQDDTRNVPGFGPTSWRSVQQLSAYWHYKWAPCGADTWISFGVPEHDRLAGSGSLGDYLVSAVATAPLNDRFLLYSQITYMHPSSSPGPLGAADEAWMFSIGLAYFHGKNARTETVADQCWMPQMPVANNGTFLVNTSRVY